MNPLSVLAADDPGHMCNLVQKRMTFYMLLMAGKDSENLKKRDKTLTRAVMQSKIRQARRSNKYMFGYLILRYKEALEFDKENNNTWADATRDEMDCIKEQEVFTTCVKELNGIQTTNKS